MLIHQYLFRRFRFVWLLPPALFLNTAIFAQIAVQGKVTDNNGQPLPEVSVIVKETSSGTTTDVNGAFSLSTPRTSSVLVFSYVGYPIQEIEVGNKTTINVSLSPAAGQLNEVVVIRHGTQKRKEVTSAVAGNNEGLKIFNGQF